MNLTTKQLAVKDVIEKISIAAGIDPFWSISIAMVESSLGALQKSSTGCVGVFQMSSIAMKDLLQSMSGLEDDTVDILCGIAFLHLLLKRHKTLEAATLKYCDPKDRSFYLNSVQTYMKIFEKMDT